MSDLIDRKNAITVFEILADKMTDEGRTVMEQAISVLRDMSSAELERTAKVDAGHKSVITGKLMDGHCMQCGRYVMDEDDYCPGCGARLEWE